RPRHHCIQTPYAKMEFDREEEWFKIGGSGFAVLMACLGAPIGIKASQDYDAPECLDKAPLWHKRLFLAALFGAELTTPATITGHGTVFCSAKMGMNKRPAHVESARTFLTGLGAWLEEFGVQTQAVLCDPGQAGVDGKCSE